LATSGSDVAVAVRLAGTDGAVVSTVQLLVAGVASVLPGIAGWVCLAGGGYVAAKHAVAALRDTLRLEEVAHGIRVSEVAPGMVNTPEFSLTRFAGDAERTAAVYAGVEPLVADDVADIICWVASRPAHVNIDLVQVTPQQQASVHKVFRH